MGSPTTTSETALDIPVLDPLDSQGEGAKPRRRPILRVGLDLTYLSAQSTGLSIYALNLVTGLAQHDHETSYVLFTSTAGRPALPQLPANFEVISLPVPHKVRFGFEQLLAPLFARQDLDVLHSPSSVAPLFYRGKIVTTVHDINYVLARDTMTLKAKLYFGNLLVASARRAARVITVSHTVHDQLLEHEPSLPAKKVIATSESIHDRFVAPPPSDDLVRATLQRYAIHDPYILFVGTLEPRKNLDLVLRAVARLRAAGRSAHKLVLAGRIGWLSDAFQATVRELSLEDAIIQTGYVPDDDLPALYRGATVFVFPSHYEGFGLPPIEAMATGTPVIVSDIPTLREVGGDAALFVDPKDVESLSTAIRRILEEPGLRDAMIERGLAQGRRYSPITTARATVEVYHTAAALTSAG